MKVSGEEYLTPNIVLSSKQPNITDLDMFRKSPIWFKKKVECVLKEKPGSYDRLDCRTILHHLIDNEDGAFVNFSCIKFKKNSSLAENLDGERAELGYCFLILCKAIRNRYDSDDSIDKYNSIAGGLCTYFNAIAFQHPLIVGKGKMSLKKFPPEEIRLIVEDCMAVYYALEQIVLFYVEKKRLGPPRYVVFEDYTISLKEVGDFPLFHLCTYCHRIIIGKNKVCGKHHPKKHRNEYQSRYRARDRFRKSFDRLLNDMDKFDTLRRLIITGDGNLINSAMQGFLPLTLEKISHVNTAKSSEYLQNVFMALDAYDTEIKDVKKQKIFSEPYELTLFFLVHEAWCEATMGILGPTGNSD